MTPELLRGLSQPPAMASEWRRRVGSAARQVGVALALPGAVVTFVGLLVVGGAFATPFWPGVVGGVGLSYAGLGTILDPDGVVEEAADADVGRYTVESPERAASFGRMLLVAGVAIVGASTLL